MTRATGVHILGRWWVAAVAGLTAGAVGIGLGSFALGAGLAPNNTISGCVNATTRVLTVPKVGHSCPAGTVSLSWNEQTEIAGKGIGTFTPTNGDNLTFANGVWGQSGPTPDALKLAELKWYGANHVNVATVGNKPYGMAFDGRDMFVANQGDNTVDEIDDVSLNIVHTYTVGSGPNGVAFDGHSIWVVNNKGDSVSRINLATQAVTGPFPVGHLPIDIAFDGTNLWVTDWGSNQVSELSDGGQLLNTVNVGVQPIGIAYTGSSIWVADSGSLGLTQINPATAKVIRTIGASANPGYVVFDGTNIWSSDVLDHQVFVDNAKTGALVADITMPNPSRGLVFDGTNIWDASPDGQITRVNVLTMKIGPTIETLPGADYLGFDGTRIWLSSATDATEQLL